MARLGQALRTFAALALPYFRSEDRWRGIPLLLAVIFMELVVVYVAVLLNQWHGRFFTALEQRNWNWVGLELIVFTLIAVLTTIAHVVMFWVGQHLQIRWRRWMTEWFIGLWMTNGRHYRVRYIAPEVDNIHLRIANDIGVFIQKTHEIGSGLVGVLAMLTSFAVILWGLSATTPLPLFGVDLSFPGYLIVVALVYAAIGTLLAHLIGSRLIPLNFRQQRFEADLRFGLARVTDHSEAVALMRGESVERLELRQRLGALVRNWITLTRYQTRLGGFTHGYASVSTVFPTLVVAPAYLAGAIPLGILMQAASAFQRVEASLSFFVGAYGKIAEWKAAMDRVAQLEAAMRVVDQVDLPNAAVALTGDAHDRIAVRDLLLRLPDGEPIAPVPDFTLAPGDLAFIEGKSGAGKSSLLRTLSGAWPFGEGEILIPASARVLVLPAQPYFPLGSLRQALAYPMAADEVADNDIRIAMMAVGLAHLADRLDEEAEWATVLSGGEQQRIGFARVLINRPTILMLDDPVSRLGNVDARALYDQIVARLPDMIVISTGQSAAHAGAHRHAIKLHSAAAPVYIASTPTPADMVPSAAAARSVGTPVVGAHEGRLYRRGRSARR
jgi:vitamin B12/bleomycin/antimicrobial peptide transport system ATP-binding/permease protein